MTTADPDEDARNEVLDACIERAFALLPEVGGDPLDLEEPLCTVAIVTSSQGVIDNGGLVALFAGDWPGQPPYSIFVDAYRRIGATATADSIEQAAARFPFDEPERHPERREEFIRGEGADEFEALTDWDTDVWGLLALYVAG
jgi:hypothetical protein